MVRWWLFGSSALRGKVEDYKTLRATLQVSARGQTYVVDRTYTTAKLMQGDAVLCIGTAPVNKHIPALLGFGLTCLMSPARPTTEISRPTDLAHAC